MPDLYFFEKIISGNLDTNSRQQLLSLLKEFLAFFDGEVFHWAQLAKSTTTLIPAMLVPFFRDHKRCRFRERRETIKKKKMDKMLSKEIIQPSSSP